MTPKLKKIIITILIIIALFLIYVIFIQKDPEPTSFIDGRSTNQSGEARLLGTQITQALLRIEQIKLDKSIFTNPLYLSLVDRSRPITPEPIGRQNPFAPIGAVSNVQVIQDLDDLEDLENVEENE